MLLESTLSVVTPKVTVANDKVSSVNNRGSRTWTGMNARTGMPDTPVATFPPGTSVIGSGAAWDNIIDHFKVS
jgi:hypothetical protein